MLHGCIPVVIMDNILPVWDPHLQWKDFSIRVAENDIAQLPSTLQHLEQTGRTQVCTCPGNNARLQRSQARFKFASERTLDASVLYYQRLKLRQMCCRSCSGTLRKCGSALHTQAICTLTRRCRQLARWRQRGGLQVVAASMQVCLRLSTAVLMTMTRLKP